MQRSRDRLNGSTTWKYYYDPLSELTGVSKNGATVQNNTYSGDGKRITQTTSGGTTVYSYQGIDVLYQKNLTTGFSTDYFYDGALQLSKRSSSSSYYYLTDELGSTREVVNSAGGTVFNSNYKPFGLTYGLSGSESLMYTGRVFDQVTSLDYFNARFYNPAIQRFIIEDRANSPKNSPDLNRYVYAADNPETNEDPTGLSSIAGFVSWLFTTDLPNTVLFLVSEALGVVPEAGDVVNAVVVRGTIRSIFVDLENLASALVNNNPTGAITAFASFATDFFSAIFTQLDLIQKVIFASELVAAGIGSILSGGALAAAIIAAEVATAGIFLIDAWYTYTSTVADPFLS